MYFLCNIVIQVFWLRTTGTDDVTPDFLLPVAETPDCVKDQVLPDAVFGTGDKPHQSEKKKEGKFMEKFLNEKK